MPIEFFLHGRPLSPEELEMIRQQIEEGFDNIAEVDDEIRGIVARNWPHLLSKLPPEEERESPALENARVQAMRKVPENRTFCKLLGTNSFADQAGRSVR
jgi:hypothetical protein